MLTTLTSDKSSTVAFQSRYGGWHPCDYATFKKLKTLHKLYWEEAVKKLAAWFRWNEKRPENRVYTQRTKDPVTGKVTGRTVLGPKPEPVYCTFFGKPERYQRGLLTVPEHLNDLGIIEAYNHARMPVSSPEQVVPLKLSLDKINELYSKIEKVDLLDHKPLLAVPLQATA